MRRSLGDTRASRRRSSVRDRTLVSPVSVLPAGGGPGAGGRVRGPVSATDERVVLGGHPLPDPTSRPSLHHRRAREGGDGFHAAPRILRRAAEDHGTVARVVQLSLLGWDGGAIRGEHGTTSRTPLVRGNHSDLLSLCARDLPLRGGPLPHAAFGLCPHRSRGMTEPDVALTDYALAIECALFASLVRRREHARFFGAAAVASLAGGTVHGFFLDPRTLGNAVLWRVTLIAIGVTAASAWAIGARVLFPAPTARRITIAAAAAFAAYCVLMLLITQDFRAAVVFYLPAAVFLLVVLSVAHARARERGILVAVAGLGLMFIAAAVQQARIALHPTYFDHNALYHLIQAVALWLLFLGLRRLDADAT